MAFQLVAEVLDHAPPMTPAERLILVAIAERMPRRCEWDYESKHLMRRTGLDARGLRAALRRLADRGLDVRVPIGTDRNGRLLYAAPGQSTRYRLPSLPAPDGCQCEECKKGGTTVPPVGGTTVPPTNGGGTTGSAAVTTGSGAVTTGSAAVTTGSGADAVVPPTPSVPQDGTAKGAASAGPYTPLPNSLKQKELARRVAAGGARTGSNGRLIPPHPFVAGETYRDHLDREVANCTTCGLPQRHRAHSGRSK